LKAFRLLAGLGALLGLMAHTDRLSACGAVYPPYRTIADTIPVADATGLPRDLGIVIDATPWSPPGGPSLDFTSFELVAEDTGIAVPGQFVQWYTTVSTAAWHPLEPLEAGRSYVLSAAIEQYGASRPAEATGADTATVRFTTGSSLASPLELSGALTIAFERYSYPLAQNCSPCGGGCELTGTYAEAVRARATLPEVRGGFDAGSYSAWLHLTEHAPAVFAGPGEGDPSGSELNLMTYATIAPGQHSEVTMDIPGGLSYPLCFALNVWDPAGHAVQAAPVCLDADDIAIDPATDPPLSPVPDSPAEDDPAQGGASGAAGSAGAMSSDPAMQTDDADASSSCSMASAPRAARVSGNALALCFGALLLCRRRRRPQHP
jgi:hypothetical protein